MSIVTMIRDIIRRVGRFPSNVDANERTGFVNRTDSTLSYDDGTRTLSITTASSYDIYFANTKKTISTTQQVTHGTDEGFHYFYFDADDFTLKTTTTFISSLILGPHVYVGYVYWDATNSTNVLDIFDERHGIQLDGQAHYNLHLDIGATWRSGLALSGILAGEDGSLNSHAQFGVAAGSIADEDNVFSILAVLSTAGLPILYLDGAGPVLREATETGFSVLTDTTAGVGVTGRLTYNLNTGGTWSVETCDNNKFVLCHVFATNSNTDAKRMYAILGQATYNNTTLARDGAETEISNILELMAIAERKPIATLIFQTNDSYANDINARIISTADGDDYIDWRSNPLSQSNSIIETNHNNLVGLQGGTAGEYYHLTSDEYSALHGLDDYVFTTSGGFVMTTSQSFVKKGD